VKDGQAKFAHRLAVRREPDLFLLLAYEAIEEIAFGGCDAVLVAAELFRCQLNSHRHGNFGVAV
jgi:hypothetical protein